MLYTNKKFWSPKKEKIINLCFNVQYLRVGFTILKDSNCKETFDHYLKCNLKLCKDDFAALYAEKFSSKCQYFFTTQIVQQHYLIHRKADYFKTWLFNHNIMTLENSVLQINLADSRMYDFNFRQKNNSNNNSWRAFVERKHQLTTFILKVIFLLK